MAAWMFAAGSALVSLWSGYKQAGSAKETGNAQAWASYQNALDMERLASGNASLLTGVAAENAAAYRYVGEINAQAIEQATMFNMALTKMETEEDVRRHVLQERYVAGTIRAATAGSGIQVNTGTPLHYLNIQQHQGYLERQYVANRGSLIMESQYQTGMAQAYISREEGRIRGDVEMRNAAAQAEMMMMESMYKTLSAKRDAGYYSQIGDANARSSIWGSWANAFSTAASIYGAVR